MDAFVLDASQRQALVCLRALGASGLRVGGVECAPGAPAFASRWCEVRAVLPDFATDARAYVDGLIRLLRMYPTRVLIPVHDGSIEALRAHRADLGRWASLALASEEALQVAVSKARTLAVAEHLGLVAPRSLTLTESGEIPSAMREIGYPAVVKPSQSWMQEDGPGTRLACRAVLNEDEAKRAVEDFAHSGAAAVVQPWLPGKRETVMLFYAGGRIWASFAQVAHRMYPPLGGASVLRESVPLPLDVMAAAERLVRFIDLEGYSEIEFRRDRAGRPALMEVNPRLSASVELAVRAGVNFPALLYAWAAGETLRSVNAYRVGVRMRWMGGDLAHLRATLNSQGRPDVPGRGRALRTFFSDFLRPTRYDYLDFRDFGPAVVAAGGMVRHTAIQVGERLTRAFATSTQEGKRAWHPQPR